MFKKKKYISNNIELLDIYNYIENYLCIDITDFEENSCNLLYYTNKECLIPVIKSTPINIDTMVSTFKNIYFKKVPLKFLEYLEIKTNIEGIINNIDYVYDEEEYADKRST